MAMEWISQGSFWAKLQEKASIWKNSPLPPSWKLHFVVAIRPSGVRGNYICTTQFHLLEFRKQPWLLTVIGPKLGPLSRQPFKGQLNASLLQGVSKTHCSLPKYTGRYMKLQDLFALKREQLFSGSLFQRLASALFLAAIATELYGLIC